VTQRKPWLLGLAACALALYALMWVGFAAHWHWIAAMDQMALDPLYSYGRSRPGWIASWDVFCTVLGPTAFRLIALAVIVVALVHRNLRAALFLVLSVELSGLITEAAKAAVHRPRPDGAFVAAWGSSFPSGHALGVMVGVLALSTLWWPLARRPLRLWIVLIGAVVVIAIGIGRVVLNVHHPSDVLAGWALGYLWFVVCVMLVPPAVAVTAADETPAAPGTAR
jgi:undecaprenyl-diphosphatase